MAHAAEASPEEKLSDTATRPPSMAVSGTSMHTWCDAVPSARSVGTSDASLGITAEQLLVSYFSPGARD